MDKRRVNKLVREIARGNTAAAEELYALMKRPLMSFAAPSLRDFPEAEDVVQSVFLKIIQKSREMTYFTDAFAWIFKIARNECNDRLRAGSRETHADGELKEKGGKDFAAFADLDLALQKLSEDDRRMVWLKYYAGFTGKEVARVFGVSETTVSRRLAEILERLRRWTDDGQD